VIPDSVMIEENKKHKRSIMGTSIGLSIVKKLLKCTVASMGLNLRKGRQCFLVWNRVWLSIFKI